MVALARPEQLLQKANHIVVGRVVDGISTDIRHRSPGGLSPKDAVRLTIAVDEVIETRPSPVPADPKNPIIQIPIIQYPPAGELITVDARVINTFPNPIARAGSSVDLDTGSIRINPSTGRLLSDNEIRAFFVGKLFIFAISGRYFAPPQPNSIKARQEFIIKYSAKIWPIEQLELIKIKLSQLSQWRANSEKAVQESMQTFSLRDVEVDMDGLIVAEGNIRLPPSNDDHFPLPPAHDRIAFRPADLVLHFSAVTAERDPSGFLATKTTGIAVTVPPALGIAIASALRRVPETQQRLTFSADEGQLTFTDFAAPPSDDRMKPGPPVKTQLLSDWNLHIWTTGGFLKMQLSAALFSARPLQVWEKDYVGHWSDRDGAPQRLSLFLAVNIATRVAACHAAYISSAPVPTGDLGQPFATTLSTLNLMAVPIDTMGNVYGVTRKGEWVGITSTADSFSLIPYKPRQRRIDGFLELDQRYGGPSITIRGIGIPTAIRLLKREPRHTVALELSESSGLGSLFQGRAFHEEHDKPPIQLVREAKLRFEVTPKGLTMFYRFFINALELTPHGWQDGWLEDEISIPWEILILRYPDLLWHRGKSEGE